MTPGAHAPTHGRVSLSVKVTANGHSRKRVVLELSIENLSGNRLHISRVSTCYVQSLEKQIQGLCHELTQLLNDELLFPNRELIERRKAIVREIVAGALGEAEPTTTREKTLWFLRLASLPFTSAFIAVRFGNRYRSARVRIGNAEQAEAAFEDLGQIDSRISSLEIRKIIEHKVDRLKDLEQQLDEGIAVTFDPVVIHGQSRFTMTRTFDLKPGPMGGIEAVKFVVIYGNGDKATVTHPVTVAPLAVLLALMSGIGAILGVVITVAWSSPDGSVLRTGLPTNQTLAAAVLAVALSQSSRYLQFPKFRNFDSSLAMCFTLGLICGLFTENVLSALESFVRPS